MFNFFKSTKTPKNSETSKESNLYENAGTDSQQQEGEKKKVHGQDGVCCGSCGGE